MASAAITCPIDVCKTRIIARDKKQQQAYLAAMAAAAAAAAAAGGAGSVVDVEEVVSTVAAADCGGTGSSSAGDAAYRTAAAARLRPDGETTDGSTVLLPLPAHGGADADASPPVPAAAPADPLQLEASNNDVVEELFKIAKEEGVGSLFLGIRQRLLYVGLANGIRLAAYGTSRMDLMMRSLDEI
jgi:hypothetical protein